jgi:hypothetical protein
MVPACSGWRCVRIVAVNLVIQVGKNVTADRRPSIVNNGRPTDTDDRASTRGNGTDAEIGRDSRLVDLHVRYRATPKRRNANIIPRQRVTWSRKARAIAVAFVGFTRMPPPPATVPLCSTGVLSTLSVALVVVSNAIPKPGEPAKFLMEQS